MAKRMGFSAAAASLSYIRDNSTALWITGSGGAANVSVLATANGHIVSANISAADFTIASANAGPVLTIAAKSSQSVDGSGTGTHLYLGSVSANRINYVTEMTSLVIASGGTVTIGTWTVTALQTANNSS